MTRPAGFLDARDHRDPVPEPDMDPDHDSPDREKSDPEGPSEETPSTPSRPGFLATLLTLASKIPLPSLGSERHEMMGDTTPVGDPQVETEVRAQAGPERIPARWRIPTLKRETRVGLAALVSFVVLVTSLCWNKVWIGKPVTLSMNHSLDGEPAAPSPEKKDEPKPEPKPPGKDKKEEPKPTPGPVEGTKPPEPSPVVEPGQGPKLGAEHATVEAATLPPPTPEGSNGAPLGEQTAPATLPAPAPASESRTPKPPEPPAGPADPIPVPEPMPAPMPAEVALPEPPPAASKPKEPETSTPPATAGVTLPPSDPPAMIPPVEPPPPVADPPPPAIPEPTPPPAAKAAEPARQPIPSPATPVPPPPPAGPVDPISLDKPPPAAPVGSSGPVPTDKPPQLETIPGTLESSATKASATGLMGVGWIAIPSGGRRIIGSVPIVSIPAEAQIDTPRGIADGPRVVDDPAAVEQVEPVVHIVQPGENFWTISKLYYRSGRFYKALHAANKKQVPDIAQLWVGTLLRIPPPEALDRTLIDPPNRSKDDPAPATVNRTSGAKRPESAEEADLAMPTRPRRIAVDPEAVDAPPAPRRPTYKVKAHETLRSIARDTLGDSKRDREIYNLNRDVLDDINVLPAGTTLTLPEDASVARRAPK